LQDCPFGVAGLPFRHTAGVDQIRVFLLDDHELVRRGLADLLAVESGIEVVG